MSMGVTLGLSVALFAALASILMGRNLSLSVAAAAISIGALGVALTASGAGFLGIFVVTIAALVLATIQLFGWMLVDVDRDHLPPTDRATWFARSLAFLLLGGGLALLVATGLERGALIPTAEVVQSPTPREIGELLFGRWRELVTLGGVALAGGLLATFMLLRDEGQRG